MGNTSSNGGFSSVILVFGADWGFPAEVVQARPASLRKLGPTLEGDFLNAMVTTRI